MAHRIIFTISDTRQRKATSQMYVSEHPYENLENFAVVAAEAINDVILGKVEGAAAILGADISAIASNVALGSSDVEEIGAAQFVTGIGTLVTCNIPSILETIIDNETGNLDQTETDVQAFLAMFEDGLTLTGSVVVQPCDVGENPVVSNRYFRERSRNSGARKRT